MLLLFQGVFFYILQTCLFFTDVGASWFAAPQRRITEVALHGTRCLSRAYVSPQAPLYPHLQSAPDPYQAVQVAPDAPDAQETEDQVGHPGDKSIKQAVPKIENGVGQQINKGIGLLLEQPFFFTSCIQTSDLWLILMFW